MWGSKYACLRLCADKKFKRCLLARMQRSLASVCGDYAASLLQPLKDPAQEQASTQLVTHVKPKGEDGSAQVQAVIDALKGSADSPLIGYPKVRSSSRLLCALAAPSGCPCMPR